MNREPRELPIHSNQDMVRALLEGRKLQTRRPCPVQPLHDDWQIMTVIGDEKRNGEICFVKPNESILQEGVTATKYFKPRYAVGDVLYVREKVQYLGVDSTTNKHLFGYVADRKEIQIDRLPSRIKPIKFLNCVPNGCFKELARIWLKVTGIRVERVQDITRTDIRAEGVTISAHMSNEESYKAAYTKAWTDAWQSCYPESWERNDHVFVYEFERIEK